MRLEEITFKVFGQAVVVGAYGGNYGPKWKGWNLALVVCDTGKLATEQSHLAHTYLSSYRPIILGRGQTRHDVKSLT